MTTTATTLQMLIVPADPTQPCRLVSYSPTALDETITAELGQDRFNRAAMIREDGHFHSGRAATAPVNTRAQDFLMGPGQDFPPFFGHGDMAITGRVTGHPLGLCGENEHLPLDSTVLEHFGVTAAEQH
ncbi:hypothetical protein V3N95_11530 (plasmid) [Micrococcaceae bacterium Sec6.3]